MLHLLLEFGLVAVGTQEMLHGRWALAQLRTVVTLNDDDIYFRSIVAKRSCFLIFSGVPAIKCMLIGREFDDRIA